MSMPFTVAFILFALVIARCAAHQKHALRAILCGIAGGFASLGAVALLAPVTGLEIQLNCFTSAAAAILGLPGVIMLLMLNVLL